MNFQTIWIPKGILAKILLFSEVCYCQIKKQAKTWNKLKSYQFNSGQGFTRLEKIMQCQIPLCSAENFDKALASCMVAWKIQQSSAEMFRASRNLSRGSFINIIFYYVMVRCTSDTSRIKLIFEPVFSCIERDHVMARILLLFIYNFVHPLLS